MSCSTTNKVTATTSSAVGNIRLTAMADEGDPSRPSKSFDIDTSNELMDALEDMPSSKGNPHHSPDSTGDGGREAISPPVPSSQSAMRPSRVSRVPPRGARRARSLPVNELRPLSDGPSAHDPMPLSARPAHFESFGPIEQFPRPRESLSLIGYVGTICDGEDGYNARLAAEVFTYNPQSRAAITPVKKGKWYMKGAFKLKKVLADKKEK